MSTADDKKIQGHSDLHQKHSMARGVTRNYAHQWCLALETRRIQFRVVTAGVLRGSISGAARAYGQVDKTGPAAGKM
jgi:hypothetical protein